MSLRIAPLALVVLFFACLSSSNAKDKKKTLLPDYVLKAHSVFVTVDHPEDGVSIEHPNDDQIAEQDVEKALMRWDRFNLVMNAGSADLIITVRKGTGKTVAPVVRGGPTDDRPVIIESTGGADSQDTRIGVQTGNRPNVNNQDPAGTGPQLGESVGAAPDMLSVYRGGEDESLNETPVWRYTAKNALHSPDVPAVDQFRKAIEEAEKQAQKQTKPGP